MEDENKKLSDQLKQAIAKNNEKPPPVKIEPPKQEPVKTEPVKTAPIPVKTEPVKTEPVKTQPFMPNYSRPAAKSEPPKYGAAAVAAAKTEPAKTEPAKTEPKKYPFGNQYGAPKSFVPSTTPTTTSSRIEQAKSIFGQPKTVVTSSTAASSTSATPAKPTTVTPATTNYTNTTNNTTQVDNPRASTALGPRHLKAIGNGDLDLPPSVSPKSSRNSGTIYFSLFFLS